MPFLRHASELTPLSPLSSLAACVLMLDVALPCFDHGRATAARARAASAAARSATTKGPGTEKRQHRHQYQHQQQQQQQQQQHWFWTRQQALGRALRARSGLLRPYVRVGGAGSAVRTDPVALAAHLVLLGVQVYFHEAGVEQAQRAAAPAGGLLVDRDRLLRRPLATAVAVEGRKRSLAAAFRIAESLRVLWPVIPCEVRKREGSAYLSIPTYLPMYLGSRSLHPDR